MTTPRERYEAKNPVVPVRLFDVLEEVQARTGEGHSKSETIRRDLRRYYELMRAELKTIELTRNEAMAVMDACNGLWLEDLPNLSYSLIWAEVEDAIRLDGLDKKWEIDGPALVEKLRSLTRTQTAALADAITRFWANTGRDADEVLREIGLVNGEDSSGR